MSRFLNYFRHFNSNLPKLLLANKTCKAFPPKLLGLNNRGFAAKSDGEKPCDKYKPCDPSENACKKEPPPCPKGNPCAQYKSCDDVAPIKTHKPGGYKKWKQFTFLLGFPLIALAGVNCIYQIMKNPIERPPFVPYEFLRRRTKRFPWGCGEKSFFHNPHLNPLPNGYEDEIEQKEE